MSDTIRHLIEALRGGGRTEMKDGKVTKQTYGPSGKTNPNLNPLEQRRRGYQLHVQEASQMGEQPQSYQEWIMQQE